MTAHIDQLGRTTAYAYDTQGHRTRVRHPDQTTELTGYDAEGRMTSRTDRMGRTRTTGYDARGRMTSSTCFDDTLLSRAQAAGGTYYHDDQIGSVRHLSDAAGSFVDSYDYSPYGTLVSGAGEATSGCLFAGERYYDAEEFGYNRVRWMSPKTGAFLSLDRLGEIELLRGSAMSWTWGISYMPPSGMPLGPGGIEFQFGIAGMPAASGVH